jgi:hypothetical protein
MANKIPAAWQSRARLRLSLPDGLVALHDDKGVIAPDRYVLDMAGGYIALMAEPEGEVMMDLAEDTAARPPRAPALAPKPVDAP